MSNYSSVYNEDKIITYNNIDYSVTQDLYNYYNLNDEIDLSCVWAISDVCNKLYYNNTLNTVNNYILAPEEKHTTFGFTWLYNAVNYSNQFVGFQWGFGDGYKSKNRPWGFDTRVIRHLNTNNILGIFNNISAIDISDGTTKNISFKDIIDNTYNNNNYIVDFYDVTFNTEFYYLTDIGEQKMSKIGIGVVMYGDDGNGSPRAIIGGKGITGQYIVNWYKNTGMTYGGSSFGNDRLDYSQVNTIYMHAVPSSVKKNITENVNGIYKINDFVYQKSADNGNIITSRLYVTLDFVKNFLASIGVYFQYNTIGIAKTIDDRINDGDVVLGQMLDNGHTTGKWLISKKEIFGAYNYDIDTENTILDPVPPNTDPNNKIDDIPINIISTSHTFLKTYLLNDTSILNLNLFLNSEDIPQGATPIDNIISFAKYPIDLSAKALNQHPDTDIKLGTTNTNVKAISVPPQILTFTMGNFNMFGKYNNFLDYEPYTTCELYIPFVDVIKIPIDKCINKDVYITMCIDISVGDCLVIVKCDGMPIAYASGSMATNISVNSNNYGLLKNALINSDLDSINTLLNVKGATIDNIVKTGVSLASNINQSIATNNANFTTTKGVNGGLLPFVKPQQPYVIVTRPNLIQNDMYDNNVGFVCNYTDFINNVTGYTVCNNVKIDIPTATQNENNMIKNLLEAGIYV